MSAWRYALERKYRIDNVNDLWEGPTPYEDFEKHLRPRIFRNTIDARFHIPLLLPSIVRDEVSEDFVFPDEDSASVPSEIDQNHNVAPVKGCIFCRFPSRVKFVE